MSHVHVQVACHVFVDACSMTQACVTHFMAMKAQHDTWPSPYGVVSREPPVTACQDPHRDAPRCRNMTKQPMEHNFTYHVNACDHKAPHDKISMRTNGCASCRMTQLILAGRRIPPHNFVTSCSYTQLNTPCGQISDHAMVEHSPWWPEHAA